MPVALVPVASMPASVAKAQRPLRAAQRNVTQEDGSIHAGKAGNSSAQAYLSDNRRAVTAAAVQACGRAA